MHFKQFICSTEEKLSGAQIESQTYCYENLIQLTTDGVVLVNRAETLYSSIDEAIDQIKHARISEDIQKQIQHEVYEDISNSKILDVIKTHHKDVRVTDTLIESYIELASSKIFTTDEVVQDIRKLNKMDQLVEGRIDCVLNDGSIVVISEDAQQKINKVFGSHPDIIEHMRESSENFLNVLNQLEE